MARKSRSHADIDFNKVASPGKIDSENSNDNDNVNVNNNVNDNVNKTRDDSSKQDQSSAIKQLLNDKKDDKVLTGVYLEPHLSKILAELGKEGGKGAKSRIVNKALTNLFEELNLL